MIELQLIIVIAAYIYFYLLIVRPMINQQTRAVGGPHIIGIAGAIGSGKTTCANIICQYTNYEDRPMAAPLKNALSVLFGFTHQQLYGNKKELIDDCWGVTPREVMQYIGTDIFRNQISKYLNIGDEFWLRVHAKSIQDDWQYTNYVISDIRFQNEVDYVHKMGGVVIRVLRETKSEFSDHASECSKTLREIDIEIENNGTIDQLREKLMRVIKL